MKHHVILGSVVALLFVGCGGDAKRHHAERNDALNETSGAQSSTFASSTSSATTSRLDSSTNPSPSTNETSGDQGRTSSTKPSSGSSGNPSSSVTRDTQPDASAGTADTSGSDAGVESEEQGPNGAACGARAGQTCTDAEYCAYLPGQLCGHADAEATCKPRPETCTADYTPVCGCDGETYSNTCAAASAGTGVMDDGPCEGDDLEPVDCETIQCIRAITCAESCDGEVVQAGCCPCPEGLIDTFVECSDATPEQ